MFDLEQLPLELDRFLRRTNPWWRGRPAAPLPPYRRWAFHTALRKLHSGLAPVTVLRGPRQVGKTTLQMQIIDHLLKDKGVAPQRILRVQFDEVPSLAGLPDPVLSIARWFAKEIAGRTFNEAAVAGEPAYLFLDEVQNLPDWAPQVKAMVDHHAVKVLITGGSALRGERYTLAGRISEIDWGRLLLREALGDRFDQRPLRRPHQYSGRRATR